MSSPQSDSSATAQHSAAGAFPGAGLGGCQVSNEDCDLISKTLSGLRFGAVTIQVHDGRIAQIERNEKYRPQAHSLNHSPA